MRESTIFLLSVLFLVVSYIFFRAKKLRAPYPPGPPPLPIIGNALDVPTRKPWEKYLEWSEQFNSTVIHYSALGTHVVVLNTLEDVIEIMERRSANYSNRPSMPVFDLLGIGYTTAALPYGDTFRKHKKILDEGLKKTVIPSYRPIQTEKVTLFLNQLLNDPAGFSNHCKELGGAITMAVAFGYDVTPGKKDPLVDVAESIVQRLAELALPGRTLISAFPFLRHIPPWFPGASTQRLGYQTREAFLQHKNEPYNYVKRKMASGEIEDCILARILERRTMDDGSCEDEELIKDAMSSIYIAAVETFKSIQLIFFLSMALHPNEQMRAQEEIDRIVGRDRLPTFNDRPSLPYVEALYREILRWRASGPLGFPHAAANDDIYKGYYIPKGSVVLANIWAITRNYPDPYSFLPERYFDSDGTLNDDNISFVFGFGRRACPGKHMGDQVIWHIVVSVLAMFSISKAKDDKGNEIDIDPNATNDSFAAEPLPFKCTIVPRFAEAESLIRSTASVVRQM